MPFDDFAMLSEEPRDTANMIGDLGLLGDGRSVEALQPPGTTARPFGALIGRDVG